MKKALLMIALVITVITATNAVQLPKLGEPIQAQTTSQFESIKGTENHVHVYTFQQQQTFVNGKLWKVEIFTNEKKLEQWKQLLKNEFGEPVKINSFLYYETGNNSATISELKPGKYCIIYQLKKMPN